jgi:hypothetical protein
LAPCDWQAQLETDLRQLHPAAVMLEVAGNSWTPCMADRNGRFLVIGSEGYYRKYSADVLAFFRTVDRANAKMTFVAPIPVGSKGLQEALNHLEAIAREDGARLPGFQIATRPRDSVSLHGRFVAKLPCLAAESRSQGWCERAPISVPDRAIRARGFAEAYACPDVL